MKTRREPAAPKTEVTEKLVAEDIVARCLSRFLFREEKVDLVTEALRSARAQGRREGLEAAVKVAEAEYVSCATYTAEDNAYNRGVGDAVFALEKEADRDL